MQEKFSGVLSPKFQENELEHYSKKNTTLLSDQRTTAENLNFINFPPSSLQTDPESLRQQFFKSEMEKIEKKPKQVSQVQKTCLFFNFISRAQRIKFFCRFNSILIA